MTLNRAPSFLSVTPAAVGADPTATSTVNSDRANRSVAASTIVPLSGAGLSIYSHAVSHAVVDLFGYFTGPAPPPTEPIEGRNPFHAEAPRRTLLVGDSTLSSIYYERAFAALRGNPDYTFDGQSCRRMIGVSCVAAGHRPNNVVEAIMGKTGSFDTVVIMAGYNDHHRYFSQAFDQVIAAARTRGATTIIFLTLRTDVRGIYDPANHAAMNAILAEKLASRQFPELVVADYNRYTMPAGSSWYRWDGVHPGNTGAFGLADYLSRTIASTFAELCPAPWAPGEAIADPCTDPDGHQLIDVASLY